VTKNRSRNWIVVPETCKTSDVYLPKNYFQINVGSYVRGKYLDLREMKYLHGQWRMLLRNSVIY
jgi:hypothetical protein